MGCVFVLIDILFTCSIFDLAQGLLKLVAEFAHQQADINWTFRIFDSGRMALSEDVQLQCNGVSQEIIMQILEAVEELRQKRRNSHGATVMRADADGDGGRASKSQVATGHEPTQKGQRDTSDIQDHKQHQHTGPHPLRQHTSSQTAIIEQAGLRLREGINIFNGTFYIRPREKIFNYIFFFSALPCFTFTEQLEGSGASSPKKLSSQHPVSAAHSKSRASGWGKAVAHSNAVTKSSISDVLFPSEFQDVVRQRCIRVVWVDTSSPDQVR